MREAPPGTVTSMRPLDRLRDLAESVTGGSDDDASSKAGSPAAAAGGTSTPVGQPGQASSGGSGYGNAETSGGGADAVPATPDAVPATRLDSGGEDHPHHEDHRSEDIAGQAPGGTVSPAERDDI